MLRAFLLLFTGLCVLLSVACQTAAETAAAAPAAAYRNPVIPDRSGDPNCIRVGDRYYLYLPKGDADRQGGSVEAYTSASVAGPWQSLGTVYSNREVAYDGFSTQGLFAPEVIGVEVDGRTKYYLYVVHILDGADPGKGNADIAVIEGSSPTDFDPSTMQVIIGREDRNYRYIDPSPFLDADGRYWITYKIRPYDETGSRLEIRESSVSEPGRMSGSPTVLLEANDVAAAHGIMEHPYLYRAGDLYYFFYSSGRGHAGSYKIGYRTATSITGPYTGGTDSLMYTGQTEDVVSPGATSIVSDCGDPESLWMVYRQKKTADGRFGNREIYVDRLVLDPAARTAVCRATRGEIAHAPVSCTPTPTRK